MKNPVAAMALAALIVAGCDEAPTSTSTLAPMSRPATTASNPKLAYVGVLTYKGNVAQTVAVMDADGSHQAHLYGRTLPFGHQFSDVSWSPTGASVCFKQMASSTAGAETSIKVIDVSVNATGAVVASTPRTLHSFPAGSGATAGMNWSSSSSMGKIAFGTYDVANSRRSLVVMPQAGGTPTVVWESDSLYVKPDGSILGHRQTLSYPTWSSDDKRLAVVRVDSSGTANPYAVCTIMIFNTTDNGGTWTYTDSISVPGSTAFIGVAGLAWSRSGNGINKLVYHDEYDRVIYYVDPTTSAVPTTNGVSGKFPFWSPDNSKLVFVSKTATPQAYLSTFVPFTNTVTDLVVNPVYGGSSMVKWKQ